VDESPDERFVHDHHERVRRVVVRREVSTRDQWNSERLEVVGLMAARNNFMSSLGSGV
jgi:hypothetical protein